MTEHEFRLQTGGGVTLFARKWVPEGPVRAVVNIVHGMMEHSGRYRHVAELLCANGIEVWCADMRGHGETARNRDNAPGEGGLPGHCADKKSLQKIAGDIDAVQKMITNEHKSDAIFLLGHSWGAFLVQYYIEFYDALLAGVVLSGTRGPGGGGVIFGLPFFNCLRFARGLRTKSRFVNDIVFGSCSKQFKEKRTGFDWLTRDEKITDSYINDPLCGVLCTIGFFRDMMRLLQIIHRNRNIDRINPDLPVYFLSGDKDPIGGNGAGIRALVEKYAAAGMKNVSFVLYPGARHECFNEINREEVITNLVRWLEKNL